MKGRAARMAGVWRKSVVALEGFSAAFFMAAEPSEAASFALFMAAEVWRLAASRRDVLEDMVGEEG